jgi:uncharacterized protein (TIGR00730 family)
MGTVTIFGSSLPAGEAPVYGQARQLGQALAGRGWAVCNGGYTGLMEASARGAREAGGHTIGVTCSVWPYRANPWIVEEVRTASFPSRLMTLIERGDAYVVLPGGTGTLAELALVWEMMNKSTLSATVGGKKPLLFVGPYWQPVIDCLHQESRLVVAGMAPSNTARGLVTVVADAEEAASVLSARFAP